MNKMTHWNPFKQLTRMEPPSTFDDFFTNFGMRPAWRDLDVLPEMRIDVSEDDKSYKIKADLPGVKKDDIDISIEGRQIAISAEILRTTEKKDETTLYSERSEGRFYRAFTLPMEIDSKKAEAHYEGGVLSLTLPKKGNGNAHRITVN